MLGPYAGDRGASMLGPYAGDRGAYAGDRGAYAGDRGVLVRAKDQTNPQNSLAHNIEIPKRIACKRERPRHGGRHHCVSEVRACMIGR